MEIARPKTKKKKKVRQISEDDELENDLQNLSLDIDFPQSSVDSFREVDLKELQALADADADEDSLDSTDEGCVNEEEKPKEVACAPSAPNFEEEEEKPVPIEPLVVSPVHTKLLYDKALYPDLKEVTTTSTAIQISEKILSPVTVKPFTPLQFEQLYSNHEIKLIEMFEGEFVKKELKDSSIQEHPLYTLLKRYGKSRTKYLVNLRNIAHLTKTLDGNYKKIWKIEKRTVSGHGTCDCGRAVRGSHDFQHAVFDEDVNSEMNRNLKELLNMSCFNHTKFSQDYELFQRQIEQMIGELMNSKAFAQVVNDSPVVLHEEVVYPDMKSKINDLRLYISILFKFLRDAVHDKFLITSVQEWIKKLVALQLRVATWQDHVFILFHILRCPVGVGNWAASLIQVPVMQRLSDEQNPFIFPEFQHCVALLSALLLPIKDRGTFLEGITKDLVPSNENVNEDVWILVDSDGEEGSSPSGECIGLKENDLVAIYDQIPFEMVFRLMTRIQKKDNGYELDEGKISGHHIIKAIAFSSKFIAILKRGLTTYDSERYKQFAKRLGRLMKHTLFYVSDIIQLYHQKDGYKDPEQSERIQVEFDELISRSALFIYESKKLSLFQYLADFPYNLVSTKSLWKLYYYLHVGDFKSIEEDVSHLILDENFSIKFNDDNIATDDLFFLLHAFAQMALSKSKDDWDFILFITLDLLQIGFINEGTRDFCYNTIKDLLTNITTKHPELIAHIFSYLKDNLQKVGTLSSYLFKALPISMWVPKTEDLEVLASWLLNFDFDSIENTTARVIFAYMNWNFDANDDLFLPHEIHVRMAFLVSEVYTKHVGESIGSGVTETARQVGTNKKTPTKKEQFSMWCWSMVSVLRLHFMDLNHQCVMSLLENPAIVNMVPEIETTHGIYQGFTEQKPLAIYLSLLVSQLGHSIPQICHRGFDQLKLLLNDYRHSKVIRCLELMTPLFVNCQESLFKCESFMSILGSLFSADKTYAKMAKEVMTADPRGPVLTFFGNMIQHQLLNHSRYGYSSPSELTQLWVNSLTRMKDWSKDPGVVWVLDVICQVAYQYPAALALTREVLRPHVAKIAETKVPKSSGLLNLISSEDKDVLVNPSQDAPTLSLLLLELEFENIELLTGLWSEFLCQLMIQNSITLANVLKKTLAQKQLPAFPFQNLVIFKLAKLIMKMSPKHFMFPIICQQFFSLYMHRVPGDVSQHEFGVQDKFYDADVSLMKKLKKIFIDSENLHIEMATKFTSGQKSQFHTHCAKIFKTYLLWLEENQLNKMTQQRIILPPQYDHPKLIQIFCGNREHWTEFIFLPELRQRQKADCNSWLAICMRYKSNPSASTSLSPNTDLTSNESVKEKMFERLKLSGQPLDPPELIKEPIHIGPVDSSKATLQLLRNESKILQKFAHQFNMMVSEHKAVDGAYRDSIHLAYTNESNIRLKSVRCSRVFDNCQSSTTIRLEFSESKANEHVKNRLEDNREFQKQMIMKESKAPDAKVVDAHFCLHNVIQQLLDRYEYHQKRGDKDQCDAILKIGTSFFYEILKEINEEVQSCPVTQELYSFTISKLGTFVQQNHNTEGQNLLKLALQRPNLVNLIAELFTPSVSAPQYFLEMYKSLVDSYSKRCDPQLLFVLFSKFDIPKWLQLHKPKLIDVSNLIQLILRGLELWNLQNSELLQDLLRCHLVNLFLYQFPEHYGEILQSVLTGFSQQRLKANVLLDLLNAFYLRVGCSKLDPEMSIGRLKDELRNFASKQNILLYNDVHSTSLMLSHHFYNERLQYGLHGLYPKFSEYCDVLCFMMGSIGHSAVASAIQAYPGIMADQLVNWLWPCLSEMFAPWLIPYYPNNMKHTPANWIQQFTSTNSSLQPWSEIHAESAGKVIRTFAMCLQYVLDMLPASNLLMGHLFCWYDGYFAHNTTPKHVLGPVQTLLMKMPWERFRPMPNHMEGLNRILMDFVPDCHLFVGNVFLRIAWTPWLQQNINTWDYPTVQRMLSILLMIFVKLSYEPKVRESIRIIQILIESVKYPWHLLEYKDVESVLDWFVMSADPSVILKIPSEHETIDSCVINLLQTASCMNELPKDAQNIQKSVVTAKRMAYVRSVVRLLKASDAKLHQLMATKQGQEMFHQACMSLLNSIQSCFTSNNEDEISMEVTNLLIPVLQNMSVPESTSKLFADAIGLWQASSQTGNILLCNTLNALKVQKQWTLSVYQLLESTLLNYLRVSESSPNHNPTWPDAHQRYGATQPNFDQYLLINNDLFLTTFLLSYIKLQILSDDIDRVTFLQELQTKLAEKKTSEATEAKVALLWGFLIVSGGHIMKRSDVSKKQLLIMARYFQVNMAQPEGWGDGLLGAIGLRKDGQSNRKKILLRCLSCAIFALFTGSYKDSPDTSTPTEYENAMIELKSTLSNKKFADVRMMGLQAISLIESKKETMTDGLNETISNIIRMFYHESFLNTFEYFNHW